MAWRPSNYLKEGELDNTTPNKVVGWMQFAGVPEKVVFDLDGNFHRDIRGARIHIHGPAHGQPAAPAAKQYMEGFQVQQRGRCGDMTAGLPPQDYTDYPYLEFYSETNGRVVMMLEAHQVTVIGTPIPYCESEPISRKEQDENMAAFLTGLSEAMGIPAENAISTGNMAAVEQAKQIIANDQRRGMKLLPAEVREQLPELGGQDGRGGRAVVYVKYFCPSSSWTWYVLEGEPLKDKAGQEVDFQFFGLVDGHDKELGYFNLAELESVTGPLGLPIERDLYWQPKTLAEVAPEMFPAEGGDKK